MTEEKTEQGLSVILGMGKKRLRLKYSDGNTDEIVLKPLTFNQIAEIEEYFNASMDEWAEKLKSMKNITFVIWVAIKKQKPEITKEMVGEFLNVENQKQAIEIMKAIFEGSALDEKNVAGATAGTEETK